jgi:hypothetical protein
MVIIAKGSLEFYFKLVNSLISYIENQRLFTLYKILILQIYIVARNDSHISVHFISFQFGNFLKRFWSRPYLGKVYLESGGHVYGGPA